MRKRNLISEKTAKIDATENIIFQKPESLSKKVFKGAIWLFTLRFLNRGLGLLRTIILARILSPDDFGLFGIALLAISTIETFSQPGFQSALIQKKDNIETYLDTAWTVSAIRGTALSMVLFMSAPMIAFFFNSPQAITAIRVLSISTLLSGFNNIGILFFKKELEFNKQFVLEFSSIFVDLIVAVTLAYLMRNVWALVWAGLAAKFVRLLMSFIIHSYRPRFRFEKKKFQDLFSYGRWVFGSSIFVFLITQGDDIFVGKVLGTTALGFYQMAYVFSNLPATEITHIISQVTFPAYSKLQDDVLRLREAYFKILQITALLSFPAAGIIFLFAPDFTKIFLGEKWMPCVSSMKILALWGLIRSIGSTTGPVFQAIGIPKTLTIIQFFHFILLTILIYPFSVHLNILGTSLSVFFSTLLPVAIAFHVILKVIQFDKHKFYRSLGLPLINTIFVLSLVYFLKKYWISQIGVLQFFSILTVYLISFFSINYFLNRFFISKGQNLFKFIFELHTLKSG